MNEDQYDSYDISFADLFRFVRRGLLPALLIALALALSALLLSRRLEPTYQSTATILATQTNSADTQFGVSLATATPLNVSAYQAAAISYPVVAEALADMGINAPTLEEIEAYKDQVSVRAEDDRSSSLLRIAVRDSNTEEAARRANALATALVAWDKQRATENLETIIDTLTTQIAAIDQEIRSIQAAEIPNQQELDGRITLRGQQAQQLAYAQTLRTSAIGLLRVLEPALISLNPVAPRPALNAALAFVLGIFLTYGILLLRDALTTRLRNTDELAKLTGLPILAEFPRLPRGNRRVPVEAVSYLRTNLLFALGDTAHKVLLVSSSVGAEGKSSVAISLAESFARNAYRTLLIDADLRKPVIASEYSLSEKQFSETTLEVLLKDPSLDAEPAQLMVDGKFPLDVIPSFHHANNPTELLNHHLRDRLDTWRQAYDIVIIDSAPLLPVADTLTIAPLASGTLLVTGMETADRKSSRAAADVLNRLGVRVLGITATQISKESRRKGEYGYGYGYGYGNSEKPDKQGARAAQVKPQPKKVSAQESNLADAQLERPVQAVRRDPSKRDVLS